MAGPERQTQVFVHLAEGMESAALYAVLCQHIDARRNNSEGAGTLENRGTEGRYTQDCCAKVLAMPAVIVLDLLVSAVAFAMLPIFVSFSPLVCLWVSFVVSFWYGLWFSAV